MNEITLWIVTPLLKKTTMVLPVVFCLAFLFKLYCCVMHTFTNLKYTMNYLKTTRKWKTRKKKKRTKHCQQYVQKPLKMPDTPIPIPIEHVTLQVQQAAASCWTPEIIKAQEIPPSWRENTAHPNNHPPLAGNNFQQLRAPWKRRPWSSDCMCKMPTVIAAGQRA